jgi:hypothetical protein
LFVIIDSVVVVVVVVVVDEQQLTLDCVTVVLSGCFFLLQQHHPFFSITGSINGGGVVIIVGNCGVNRNSKGDGELFSCFGAIGRKISIFIFFFIPAKNVKRLEWSYNILYIYFTCNCITTAFFLFFRYTFT